MRAKNYKNTVGEQIQKSLPPLYADIWMLMADVGIRVGDAVGLKSSDIDDKGYLHYTASKTGKRARVKLSSDVYKLIQRRISTADNYPFPSPNYLFPSPSVSGAHVSRQAVWQNIKKACKRCGIMPNGISPHSCRKHFAVEVYDKDGLSAAMSKLQHSSPNTTYLYLYDENPIEYLKGRLYKTEKELKALKKSLKEVLYVVNICCDRLIGDDTYMLTNKGKKVYDIDLSELDGNIF